MQPPASTSLFVVAALLAAACLAPCCLATQAVAEVTPTMQVINMLTELKAKGEQQMNLEQKTFAAYAEWVDDRSKELAFDIQDGQAKIEELVAFIDKADSDAAKLGREIGALNAEIDKLGGELKAAKDNRDMEHGEYLKLSKDYAESVDALLRAIQVLSVQDYDRAQAEALLQSMSTKVPGMPRVLAAFMQEKSRSSTLRGNGAPEVAAYKFQSNDIVEMLQGLLKKFKGELGDVEEDEANQAHEFSLVKIHLSNTIAKDTSDRDEKSVAKGKKAAASAKAKGELEETKASKAADEKLKSEIETTFKVKSATYEENQKIRKQELEAIAQAVEIISSPEVSGSYAKHINFVQVAGKKKAPVSLIQLRRSRRRVTAGQRASEYLKKRAASLHSKALADAATQIAASPFAKVIDMVETLLQRLKEEAAAEADHKAWCDEQLKANKLKRNKKTAQANELMAEIEGLTANIDEMGASIQKLVEEQAALTKAMAEATKQREDEKATNLATIADAAAGVKAISQATAILKEFYDGHASLLQQVPEMAAYKGMQSSKGGVIGMLEVIETDFARLKAETEASEKTAAREYSTFMEESKASKLAKHNEEVKLRLDKDQLEFERSQTQKDLSATQEELARASTFFEYLKPNCLQVHVNWEERAAHRKEEIESLKEAWRILDQKSKQ